MERQRKLAALRRCLRSEGQGSGSERSFFCWFPRPDGCGGDHHKPKLAVNLETDRWHCWVCGKAGHDLRRIFALGGKSHPDYADYAAEHESSEVPKGAAKQYEPVSLPPEFRALCVPRCSLYQRQAIAYLGARGITPDDILTYKIGYCESGQYAERVVLPSFDEHGALSFFTARAIWKRMSPPYLHGRFDKDVVFNDLLVDWSRPVTLVEGPFDAIKAGTQAIALQGKQLLPKLLRKILDRRPVVNVALDDDAFEPALAIAKHLVAQGVDARMVDLGGKKDPGEMERDEFEQRLACAKPADDLGLLKLQVSHSGTRA